jgi:hypothetical protein
MVVVEVLPFGKLVVEQLGVLDDDALELPVELLLWVPRTSSTSCDQAVFVDHATDASLSSDMVLLKVDRFR